MLPNCLPVLIFFSIPVMIFFIYLRSFSSTGRAKGGTVGCSMMSYTFMYHFYSCKMKVENFCSELLWFHSLYKDVESSSEQK